MNRKRWLEILNNLNEKEAVSSEELAEQLKLSSRTVRTELKNLKEVLEEEGAQLISKTKTGTILKITDQTKYLNFLESLMEKKKIPETSEERVQYLLEMLLANNDRYLRMEDLCDQIFISRTRLAAELREVKEILKEYHLELIMRPRYGIRIKGKEMDFRLCIAGYTIAKLENKSAGDNNEMLKVIDTCIRSGLRHSEFRISDISYQNLIIHIYILLKRIEKGCYIPLAEIHLEELRKEKQYQYAKNIVYELKKQFLLDIPEVETGYITIHLLGKQILEYGDMKNNIVVTPEINDIVTSMLDKIYENYHLRFHDDLELRMTLGTHLVPFAVRMKYDIGLKNPVLLEIRSRYMLAYMISITACEVLRGYFHKQISDDEVGYFALMFGLALERKKSEGTKKNIVIVCSTGRGSAQMLLWRMQDEFGKHLNQISTCDLMEMETYDCKNIDYIITTVPIPFSVSRPILQVQLFMQENDIRAIRNLLNGKQISFLNRYYSQELFLTGLEAKDQEEVIRIMVERIHQVKEVPDNYFEAVMRREHMASTAFGNMIAVPHPDQSMGKDTFVCIAVLKKPILWSGKKVQFVFMLSVKSPMDEDMQYFSRVTSKFLFSREAVGKVIKNPQFLVFMEILKKIEKEIREKDE